MAHLNLQNRIINKIKYIWYCRGFVGAVDIADGADCRIKNFFFKIMLYAYLFLSTLQIAQGLEDPKTDSTQPPNSGLFGKELTEHNQQADISFRGDTGLKKDDFYDLTGHVFLKQDNTTLTAHSARLYYSKKIVSNNSETKTSRSGIEHAIAKGDVKISKTVSPFSPAFKANADEVELLTAEHKLILRGHAKFWRADEFIHAEIMTIDLDTNDISLQEPRGTFAAKKMEQAKGKATIEIENDSLSTPSQPTPSSGKKSW